MGQTTKIEWTDYSSNPIRARRVDGKHRVPGHYCEKISAGCANCYASRTQARFRMPKFPGASKLTSKKVRDFQSGPMDGLAVMGDVYVQLNDAELTRLLRSRKISGKKVFICDMTDLFGWWVPDAWIDRIFAVMALRPDVTWQVLTKRPERMAEYFADQERTAYRITCASLELQTEKTRWANRCGTDDWWPMRNVWLGCSVENQQTADERIPHLLRCPATVRFLSCEPLLGPVDLMIHGECSDWACNECGSRNVNTDVCVAPDDVGTYECNDCGYVGEGEDAAWTPLIHLLIIGGESGPGARPTNIDWIRSLVRQGKEAGCKTFVKQLGRQALGSFEDGEHAYAKTAFDDTTLIDFRDPKGGDPSEWPEDLRVREFPGGAK